MLLRSRLQTGSSTNLAVPPVEIKKNYVIPSAVARFPE